MTAESESARSSGGPSFLSVQPNVTFQFSFILFNPFKCNRAAKSVVDDDDDDDDDYDDDRHPRRPYFSRQTPLRGKKAFFVITLLGRYKQCIFQTNQSHPSFVHSHDNKLVAVKPPGSIGNVKMHVLFKA